MIIQMESIKPPKRIIKKQLKNVNKAIIEIAEMKFENIEDCLLYTSPSPRDSFRSRMPSSA